MKILTEVGAGSQLGKAYLVLHDEAKWVGLVELDFNALAGAENKRIVENTGSLFARPRGFSVVMCDEGNAREHVLKSRLALT